MSDGGDSASPGRQPVEYHPESKDLLVPVEHLSPNEPVPDNEPHATSTPDSVEQPDDVRRWQLPLIVILILAGVVLLGLLVQGLGLLRFAGDATVVPTRELVLGGDNEQPQAGFDPAGNIPPPGISDVSVPPISTTFLGYYDIYGGERILGRPISGSVWVNGREVQWFQRARLEHWPEHAGTPFEVQQGLIGIEFTQGRTFAPQIFFVGGPDLRYFPETGHGVGGRFLVFWEQYGGLVTFGLPISEEFDEVMPDGRGYRVQYFERARMEYHPEHTGTPYEVQLGLLGTALLNNDAQPTTTQPRPTLVPLP